jgi:hypothetical protein
MPRDLPALRVGIVRRGRVLISSTFEQGRSSSSFRCASTVTKAFPSFCSHAGVVEYNEVFIASSTGSYQAVVQLRTDGKKPLHRELVKKRDSKLSDDRLERDSSVD